MNVPPAEPLLSILIPAYGYAEGVRRILDSLGPFPQRDIEVIVFDDSSDHVVEKAVHAWTSSTSRKVMYRRNRPALGAIANWNSLTDAARGAYCVLLHHDEFPLGARFAERLLERLRRDTTIDVLVLDCLLIHGAERRMRRHLPTWLRSLVVSRMPAYLFRRNAIGPHSVVVARTALYPKFDTRLRWLVDVEAYVRLLGNATHVRLCSDLAMASDYRREDSITARMAPELRRVDREERDYLRGTYPGGRLWLGPARGEPATFTLLRALEIASWAALRGVTRLVAAFDCSVHRGVACESHRPRPT